MPPRPRPSGLLACLLLASLLATCAQGALHLTEFLADNSGPLQDADGDHSDWIEIFNSGPDPADLSGHSLTDDPALPSKWIFPAVTLAPGEFLVLFASGKDRRDPAGELHTNFRLERDGEYLALIASDGVTPLSEFGAPPSALPAQYEGISYGLLQTGDRTATVLLNTGDTGRVLVPADDSVEGSWYAAGFDDSAWQAVSTGIGYDRNSTYIPEFGAGGNLDASLEGVNTSVYLRVPFEIQDSASLAELVLRMKYDDGFAAFLNGDLVASANAPGALAYDSEATANHADSSSLTFEEFDLAPHLGLLRTGTNILAIQGLNDGLGSSDMLITPELHGVLLTDPSIGGQGYLSSPTPGTYNGPTFDGFVADTKFSVDRGFFENPFTVEITSATVGAEIRYTVDGSTPAPDHGSVYTGPITISGTTILRAMAHRPGFQPTNVDTHTYLFPSDVVDQPRMRSAITQSAQYGPQMNDSLRAVPTISLVTENSGFLNEGGSNIREEYPASIEMIFPDGTPGFQENAGLSNYGGRFTNFRKKSFRVAFRTRFGTNKLRYPIFEGFHYENFPPAEEFDAINLRSGSHDMASRGAYMSNRFADDTMIEMGNVAPHGRFVHVYLNGNYWGQYHLRERWSADMASSYFGGPEEQYDAVNANDNFRDDEEVYDGDGTFWADTKSLVAGADPFRNASGHIDVPNIIDFMLLWVSGNSESEFRSFGSATQGVPFKFMMKDADGFLRSPGHAADHPGPLNVMSLMRSGAGGEDFAILVADRIHKHFFNEGALTPARNIARLQRRVDEARLGFLSEAARWGDVFREPSSWESYQQNLLTNHFPGLTQTMISRFRAAGMYPETIAPVFSRHGGSVSPATGITMATDADRIYYTTDGSDPRLAGGAPNPTAGVATFAGGGPSPVTYLSTGDSWRYLDNGSDQGNAWRAAGFNDSTWAAGPSPLGYGGDGEATTVSYGPDDQNKFATTYFRTAVEVPDPSIFNHFLVRIRYDDAAAIYLNGTQIFRSPNLADNAAYDQYASSTTSGEDTWHEVQIPTTALDAGTNVLAVEIHQASGTSSDIRFDLVLRGETGLGGGSNVSDPLHFSQPVLLRARAYNTGTGEWSALNEASFTIDTVPADATNLAISEMHYHPAEPATPEEIAVSTDRDDYEFIELLNIGTVSIDLGGARFESGITFAFPEPTVLEPGERLLLVRDPAAFAVRYGSPPGVQWFQYAGRLSNDGEEILLVAPGGAPLQQFTYNDQLPWPLASDGLGPSMVRVAPSPGAPPSDPGNWTASAIVHGSPGAPEPATISYLDWASSYGLTGQPGDDDDGDSFTNYFEYLAGSRPDRMDDTPGFRAALEEHEIDGSVASYLTVTFRQNLHAEGSLTVETSTDLLTWSDDPSLTALVSRVEHGDGAATITVRATDPAGLDLHHLFVRLRGD